MNKKTYRFCATLLFTCEAECEDAAWEQFSEHLSWVNQPSDFNDIEVEEDEQVAAILWTFRNSNETSCCGSEALF